MARGFRRAISPHRAAKGAQTTFPFCVSASLFWTEVLYKLNNFLYLHHFLPLAGVINNLTDSLPSLWGRGEGQHRSGSCWHRPSAQESLETGKPRCTSLSRLPEASRDFKLAAKERIHQSAQACLRFFIFQGNYCQ